MSIFISRVGSDKLSRYIQFRATANDNLANYYLTKGDNYGKGDKLEGSLIMSPYPISGLIDFYRLPDLSVAQNDLITAYRSSTPFIKSGRRKENMCTHEFSISSDHSLWDADFPVIVKYDPTIQDPRLIIPES